MNISTPKFRPASTFVRSAGLISRCLARLLAKSAQPVANEPLAPGVLPLAVVALSLLILPCLALPSQAQAVEAVGRITRAQGEITARSKSARREVTTDDPVYVGETLSTGDKARAELTLSDGSLITLSENTEFAVTRFEPDKGKARFEMLRGAFRTVTGAISQGAAPEVEINTPLATLGIRGTDFWGGFFSAKELGVFMVSGKGVTVRNKFGRQEITQPGQGVTVRSANAAPEPVVTWPKDKVQRAIKTVTFY